jgi:multisubunit Na+/H+ antiporter MnhE subunit
MLFWLLLTSTVDPQEVVAGIAAAAVAATIMTVVQRSIRRPVRIRARWLWPAWRIPILIARDTVTLTVLLGRKLARRPTPPGAFDEVPMKAPATRGEVVGKDLLATLGISLSPNTIVVGFDPEREVLVVHSALPSHPRSVRDLLSPR